MSNLNNIPKIDVYLVNRDTNDIHVFKDIVTATYDYEEYGMWNLTVTGFKPPKRAELISFGPIEEKDILELIESGTND